ncbi:hypothetical protein Tco_0341283 [Tanacetum coccineum]
MYEKVKKANENFIAIGSAEDERLIRKLNKKVDGDKQDESIKEKSKKEEGTKKRKLGTRKKMKSRKRRFRQETFEDDKIDSEKENDELRLCLTIASDEDKEVDYEILDRKYPIIEWKTEYLRTKPQYNEMLSIFDREDLKAVYQLVMDKYQGKIPEGFDRVLWGDLMIMFNPSDEDVFWNLQQGLVIHMLVKKKYPLRNKVLLQMLELKLESEEDSTMALELIRFIKKLITELESENCDGDEQDL